MMYWFQAKADGFLPGGASLHSCMIPHGPDTKTYEVNISSTTSRLQVVSLCAFLFFGFIIIWLARPKWTVLPWKFAKVTLLELPTFGSPVCFDNSFDLQATIAGRNEAGPHKITDTMAFMFESFLMPRTCPWALDSPFRDHDYYQCLIGLKSHFSCEKTNGKTTDLQNGLMEMGRQSHHEWFGLETLTLALSSYLIN